MRNCAKCGHANPDDALFCGGCGEKFSPRVQQQRKIAAVYLYSIIGAGVLLFVGLIVFAFMSNRNDQPPQAPLGNSKSIQTPAKAVHRTPVRTMTNIPPVTAPAAYQPPAQQPPVCTPNWQCDNWNLCSSSNQQSRYCHDTNGCGVTTGKPATTQSCTCTPNWQCGGWGYCFGQQARVCADANDCGVTTNEPATTQSCTPQQ